MFECVELFVMWVVVCFDVLISLMAGEGLSHSCGGRTGLYSGTPFFWCLKDKSSVETLLLHCKIIALSYYSRILTR